MKFLLPFYANLFIKIYISLLSIFFYNKNVQLKKHYPNAFQSSSFYKF